MDPALKQALGWLAAALVTSGGVLALRIWRRAVCERLERLAARRGGRFVAGPWSVVPRVECHLGDGLLQATLHTESAEDGGRGCLCSSAHASGARVPEFELELRRAERLQGEWQVPESRDGAFARVFRLRTDDEPSTRALLDAELRRALLEFDPALDVALRLGPPPSFATACVTAPAENRAWRFPCAAFPTTWPCSSGWSPSRVSPTRASSRGWHDARPRLPALRRCVTLFA